VVVTRPSRGTIDTLSKSRAIWYSGRSRASKFDANYDSTSMQSNISKLMLHIYPPPFIRRLIEIPGGAKPTIAVERGINSFIRPDK